VKLVWERGPQSAKWRYALTALVAAVAGAAAALWLG